MSPILGKNLLKALRVAGIADEITRRVTIDIPCDDVVRIYIERYGDARLLDIIPAIAEDASLRIEQVEPTVPEGMVEVTSFGDTEPQFIPSDPNGLSEKDIDHS
jgi:hypothetical protein